MDPADYSVIGIGCDVSSELSVQQAYRRTMDTYGRIDSVVASAGARALLFFKHVSDPLTPVFPQVLSRTTPRSTTPLTG